MYLSIYQSILRSIFRSVYLPVYLSVYPSIHLSIYLSIDQPICLSIYQSIAKEPSLPAPSRSPHRTASVAAQQWRRNATGLEGICNRGEPQANALRCIALHRCNRPPLLNVERATKGGRAQCPAQMGAPREQPLDQVLHFCLDVHPNLCTPLT